MFHQRTWQGVSTSILTRTTRRYAPIQPSFTIAAAAAASTIVTPVSSSSTSLFSPPSSSLHTSHIRHAHFPRTVRGVGPSPRTPAFYRRPWLKRRLIADRARWWPKTHTTSPLASNIKQEQPEKIQLKSHNFQTGEETETVELSPTIFQVPLRRDVIWQVVRWQRACRRQGTHKAKNRAEVYGSGKKARPQKGTGQARMGDKHAPHHVGGGNAFPRRPAKYAYDMPSHIIALGKRIALSAKYAEGNLMIIDQPVSNTAAKEKFMENMKKLGLGEYLMVHLHGELDPNIGLACRRFPQFKFLSDREINVYDLVNARRLILTKKALMAIEWRLAKENAPAARAKRLRWMVGSYGGGYTREEIEFVKPDTKPEGDAKIVPEVEVDGLKLLLKSGKPYETPIHWP